MEYSSPAPARDTSTGAGADSVSATVVASVRAERGAVAAAPAAVPRRGVLAPDENLVSPTAAVRAPNAEAARLSSRALEASGRSVATWCVRLAGASTPCALQLEERSIIKLLVRHWTLIPGVAVLVAILELIAHALARNTVATKADPAVPREERRIDCTDCVRGDTMIPISIVNSPALPGSLILELKSAATA